MENKYYSIDFVSFIYSGCNLLFEKLSKKKKNCNLEACAFAKLLFDWKYQNRARCCFFPYAYVFNYSKNCWVLWLKLRVNLELLFALTLFFQSLITTDIVFLGLFSSVKISQVIIYCCTTAGHCFQTNPIGCFYFWSS